MEYLRGFAIRGRTNLSFEDTISQATELLKEQGFGVLTEIDVTATLKKKLDLDYKPFKILGACNPGFAHKALEAEPMIGVMLPCNVIIIDEGDHRVVAAMDPAIMASIVPSEEVKTIAGEVGEKLGTVVKKLEEL